MEVSERTIMLRIILFGFNLLSEESRYGIRSINFSVSSELTAVGTSFDHQENLQACNRYSWPGGGEQDDDDDDCYYDDDDDGEEDDDDDDDDDTASATFGASVTNIVKYPDIPLSFLRQEGFLSEMLLNTTVLLFPLPNYYWQKRKRLSMAY